MSHWQSREGLIQCLQRSSYIPLFTGPAIASWQYLDGGIFTGNWPSLSGTKTEFSSPFAGPRFEIAPRGDTTERQQSARIHGVYVDVSAHNLQAAWGALVPWDEDRLQRLYERGQADARSFLSSLDSTGSEHVYLAGSRGIGRRSLGADAYAATHRPKCGLAGNISVLAICRGKRPFRSTEHAF